MSLIMDVLRKTKESREAVATEPIKDQDGRAGVMERAAEILDSERDFPAVTFDRPETLFIEEKSEEPARPVLKIHPAKTADLPPAALFWGKSYLKRTALVLLIAVTAGLAGYRWYELGRTGRAAAPAVQENIFAPAPAKSPAVSPSGGLEGIILGSGEPLCLMGGRILGIGGVWEDKMISAIAKDGVTVEDRNGQKAFIPLPAE